MALNGCYANAMLEDAYQLENTRITWICILGCDAWRSTQIILKHISPLQLMWRIPSIDKRLMTLVHGPSLQGTVTPLLALSCASSMILIPALLSSGFT
jgi:hypothetical protein